jgi:squalene-hopene/tetraprenyl-beta-curcumene cyclase
MKNLLTALSSACLGFWCVSVSFAGDVEVNPPELKAPAPNSPDEPLAKEFSLAKAAEFLDAVSVTWTREKKCGTCHTNYAYLFARPVLREPAPAAMAEVRGFFEGRAANWETAKPRWPTEVVATAVALAVNDAATTGKLHPLTRKALDAMWKLQRDDGTWDWLKCDWPPMEHDDYFGAVYAAVGAGSAPEGYADSPAAKDGVEKLRRYLTSHPALDLHHRAALLWASVKLEGLLAAAERDKVVKELLAAESPGGGWSLASLGTWTRHDGSSNAGAPADGYGTGFVVHVLRQAGVPASEAAIQRGVAWLKAHQRESGRWFTRSLSNDKHHYISHAGTAYAVLALAACGEVK